jgi:excisionase family DNA binding protein
MTESPDTQSHEMTVRRASELLGASRSTIRLWIRKGLLTAYRKGPAFAIPEQPNFAFISGRLRAKRARPLPAYVPPEISRYSEWHQVLDEFARLAKAVYSEPADLKRRRFRLDVLFARYLAVNRVSLASIRRTFPQTAGALSKGVWEDLQRGWYNELVFSYPPRTSTLGLSFADITINEEASAKRFTFPSWRITTAYYAIYFYLRALTRIKQPMFRFEEHRATLTNFKACALQPLQKTVWFFPLSVAVVPGQRSLVKAIPHLRLRHLRHAYASHPRPPGLSAVQAYRHILTVFRRRAASWTRPTPYTLFDYLHDFRVWANYLEIEHLLNLRGPGYKAFMDQALALVLFFVGGVTELVLLASSGPTRFLNRCQRFFSLLAASSVELAEGYPILPLSQRLDLFWQLDLIPRGLFYEPKLDPNKARIRFDDRI